MEREWIARERQVDVEARCDAREGQVRTGRYTCTVIGGARAGGDAICYGLGRSRLTADGVSSRWGAVYVSCRSRSRGGMDVRSVRPSVRPSGRVDPWMDKQQRIGGRVTAHAPRVGLLGPYVVVLG